MAKGRPAKLLVTPSFHRSAKKLSSGAKAQLDLALEHVALDVECGQGKAGDLVGVRVYKFKLANQTCLLAYRILDQHSVKLLAFGPHENFYRNLKRGE